MTIEKALAAAVEPLVDDIVALEKRIDNLQLRHGKDGVDGKDGRDGVDGKDAAPVDEAAIVDAVVKQIPVPQHGKDGKDADPVAVALILVEKHADILRGEDGKSPSADEVAEIIVAKHAASLKGDKGDNGADARPDVVADVLRKDADFLAAVRGEAGPVGPSGPAGDAGSDGVAGRDGRDGVGIRSVEVGEKSFDLVLDNDQIIEIPLPKAKDGIDGKDGRDGKDAEPVDVIKLAADIIDSAAFINKVKSSIDAEPWEPRIYVKGEWVSHYTGRTYVAIENTTDEPGDSAHWKRIGTEGIRHTGGFKGDDHAYEAGDMYAKDGSTFFYDGKTHRLFAQKPLTDAELKKAIKAVEKRHDAVITAMAEKQIKLEADLQEQRMSSENYAKALSLLDDYVAAQEEEPIPIVRWMGDWEWDKSYKRGEVARYKSALWICFDPGKSQQIFDNFELMATGGGGGSGGQQLPVQSPFNVIADMSVLPAAGAANGDTYYVQDSRRILVWDAANTRWDTTRSPAEVVPNEAAVIATAGAEAGMMRLAAAEGTGWMFNGTTWVKLGSTPRIVADQAARAAASPTAQNGDIVVQRDDNSAWVWDANIPVPAWQPMGVSVRLAADATARQGMTGLVVGTLVIQQDDHSLWRYGTGAAPWMQIGGAGGLQKVATVMALTAIPATALSQGDVYTVLTNGGVYVYRPVNAAGHTGTMADWQAVGTSEVIRVPNLAALNGLVDAMLPPGKTVIVNDMDGFNTFGLVVRHRGVRTHTLLDFDVIHPDPAGPPIVLADTPADLPAEGEPDTLYIVRHDAAGVDLNRRLVWDPALAVHIPPPVGFMPAVNITNIGNDWIVDLVTTGDAPFAAAGTVQFSITTVGGPRPGADQLAANCNAGQTVTDTGNALVTLAGLIQNGAIGAVWDTPSGTLTFTGQLGATIVNLTGTVTGAVSQVPPIVQPTGDWRNLDTQTVLQPQRVQALPTTSRVAGDLALTTEADHSRISVYDGTNWLQLLDEDEIKEWIAAGALFRGTVADVAHAGAIALETLPMPDAANRGNYWTWTGPANFEVQAGLTDPAAREVTIANVVTSVAAGQTGSFQIAVDGAGAVGTGRRLYFRLTFDDGTTDTILPLSIDVVTTDDAAAIVGKIVAAWGTQHGATLSVNGADPTQVDVTPAGTDLFGDADMHPDGATPGIGVDLGGELLQVGDWLQSNGVGWVHVASDLLSKSRGDKIYGLLPWQDGGWERGALVYFDEGIYRASRPVIAGDLAPSIPTGQQTFVPSANRAIGLAPNIAALDAIIAANPANPANLGMASVLAQSAQGGTLANGITIAPHEGVLNTGNPAIGANGWVLVTGLTFPPQIPAETIAPVAGPGGAVATAAAFLAMPLPDPANMGQWFHIDAPIIVPIMQTGAGAAFGGQTIPAGSTVMVLRDRAQGTSGYSLVQGPGAPQPPVAVNLPLARPNPIFPPYVYNPPPGISPWQKLDLRGTFISIPDDTALPPNAAGDHLYFVQSSVRNGGRPAMYRWDANRAVWQNVADSPHPLILYANETDLQAANPGVTDFLGFALQEGTLWRWSGVAHAWAQMPLLTKPRADRLYVADYNVGETWEQGAVVVYHGRLYRASRAITATDPLPHPAVIPFRNIPFGATPNEEWDTALDATLDAQNPVGAGWWVRANQSMGYFPDQAHFGCLADAGGQLNLQAGDGIAFLGGSNINGVTTTGKPVCSSAIKYTAAEIAAAGGHPPTTIFVKPTTPWVPVTLDGGIHVYANEAALPQDALDGTIAAVWNAGTPLQFIWQESTLSWLPISGAGGVNVTVNDTHEAEPAALGTETPIAGAGTPANDNQYRVQSGQTQGSGNVGIYNGRIEFWPGSHNNTHNPTAALTALGAGAAFRLRSVLYNGTTNTDELIVVTAGAFQDDGTAQHRMWAPIAYTLGKTRYATDYHNVTVFAGTDGDEGDVFINTADARTWTHDGSRWVENTGGTILVRNEDDRLGLVDIADGTLVVQQDTGWTWRWQAGFANDPFWSPWRVFSDYVGADSIAARNALETHIHIGTLVSVGNKMYQYVVNPNAGTPGQHPGIWVDFGQVLNPPGLEGIIVPTAAPADPGTFKWAQVNATVLGATPPGSYFVVADETSPVPAGVPSIAGQAVKAGDWVVAIDGNGDGTSDAFHLVSLPAADRPLVTKLTTAGQTYKGTEAELTGTTWHWITGAGGTAGGPGDIVPNGPQGTFNSLLISGTPVTGTPDLPNIFVVGNKIKFYEPTNHANSAEFVIQTVTLTAGTYIVTLTQLATTAGWNALTGTVTVTASAMVAIVGKRDDIVLNTADHRSWIHDGTNWIEFSNGVWHAEDTNAEAQTVWMPRHLERFGLTTANDALSTNAVPVGLFEMQIGGVCRNTTGLSLLLEHDSLSTNHADDIAVGTTGGHPSVGPWNVKSQTPWWLTVKVSLRNYGNLIVEFTGTGADGKRIFDRFVLDNNTNTRKLPGIGVTAAAGGIYTQSFVDYKAG